MHESAYDHGRQFFELYWNPDFTDVIDLGSQDVNGTLRDHVPDTGRYLGLDMVDAKGVDMVVTPGEPLPLPDASADVIVTSSAFEHDACFWVTFLDLVRVLRPGGLLYVNAPSNNAFHRYPVDCWRFYPDAGLALVEWGRRSGVEVELVESFVAEPQESGWADFIAIFRKPGPPLRRKGTMASLNGAMNVHDAEAPDLTNVSERTFDMLTIDRLEETMTARDAEMAAAATAAEEARAALSALEGEAGHLRAELQAMRDSTSWRMTSVVRKVGSLARRSNA